VKSLDNSASISPAIANLAFKLALRVAPQASRDWLEDMRLEAPFIETDAERIRWAVGALITAIRFRLASLSLSRPQTFTLASALMMTVFAVFVLVPQSGLNVSPVPGQEEVADFTDNQLEPSAPVQQPAETEVAAPPQLSLARERSQASEAAADAEARAVLPSTDLLESEATPETDEAAFSANQRKEALNVPSSAPDAEADALGLADASVHLEVLEPLTLSPVPAAVTEVQAGPATLKVRSTVWLELVEGSPGNRRPLLKGQVQAGESFELKLPFYIQTDNAAAIMLSVEGQRPEPLGPEGVALGRLFRLSR